MKTLNVKSWPVWAPNGRKKLLAALIGVALLGSLAQITVAWATALPDDAVLRVGDEVVTQDQFEQRITVLKALYGVQPPAAAQLERFHQDAAKSMAVSTILDRAAAEMKIVVAEKTVLDTLDRLVREQMPQGREAFTEFLGNQGISESDVLDEIQRQMKTSRLFADVTKDVPGVTDADVRKAYSDRREQLATAEERRLRNMVVRTEDEAKKVAKQARSGKAFADLARRFSLDRASGDKGGELGTVTAEQLEPAFAKAAFTAPDRAVFGPVRTRHGWNVGQVAGVTPAKPLSYQQVAQQLRVALGDERKLNAWRSWLTEQIKAADVEYAADYRPRNPDAPPSDTPR